MTTAAMTVRRRTGAEAMMVVVPTNLEGMAVNMVVVMIMFMARVGWNTNLCGALKGSGEEDGTSLGREEDQGGPWEAKLAAGSLPPTLPPPMGSHGPHKKHSSGYKRQRHRQKYNHKDICFPGVVFGSASCDGVLPNWHKDTFLIAHLSLPWSIPLAE